MKLSANWLREWVNPRVDAAEIAERLTLAGLETEAETLSAKLSGIVVGLIREIQPHPQAERLRICAVDVGQKTPLSIVCGAANARAGMKAPVALVGARLPDGAEIKQASLRGVESAGMLCSAKELGLAEKSEGLLELDADAAPGQALAEYLKLEDTLLNLELTPNRGDCLSIAGLAREVSAVFGVPIKTTVTGKVKTSGKRRQDVKIEDKNGCSRYAGRVISGLDPAARTPDWMRERLRRSGLRCIHPVVDVTNYVMLELGQPLHAFDCARLRGSIRVRRAQSGESLQLLNEQTVNLAAGDLLIADEQGPLALAGIMGGLPSAVTGLTTDIFLESACFAPERVAAAGRRLKLPSDALYRFERGVDPDLQARALERATELIIEIGGGEAGPVTLAGARPARPATVRLRRARLDRLLGHEIPGADVERLLKRLGLKVKRLGKTGWQASIPGYRYDLRIEADLVEEVARLYGYHRIPARPYAAQLAPMPLPEQQRPSALLRDRLVARGYQEVLTYSFVEPKLQEQLTPGAAGIALDNPMAETMSVMRTTLWSGLIPAWRYNHQRQQPRVRIFETGVCFGEAKGKIVETLKLGGLVAGAITPEQWGVAQRAADFFDVKADLEALFGADVNNYRFERVAHPALHPGQTARIHRGAEVIGWLGALHPRLVQSLDLPQAPLLFEFEFEALRQARMPRPATPSEFPSSRRDLAVVLKEETPAAAVIGQVRSAAGPQLHRAQVFDVYRGAGLPNGFKSVALSLIFQDNSRTLTDEEVDAAVQAAADRLIREFGASIRGEKNGGVNQG